MGQGRGHWQMRSNGGAIGGHHTICGLARAEPTHLHRNETEAVFVACGGLERRGNLKLGDCAVFSAAREA